MSDSRELAHHEPGGGSVAHRPASTSIPMEQQMDMLRTALTDPNVDPAKAREMFALMREMQQDARQAEFNRAKSAAIRAMPAIFKRGKNSHLDVRYARFEDMHRAVMPVLSAHSLSLDFRIGSEGRNVTVQPILRHDNGYVEEGGVMSAPPTQGKGINAVQEVAITASYLKRHSMKATLNLIEDGEDLDGGPPREGDQLNDRQERLLVDAQEAADRGEYAGFYQRLNTKDRALLVSTGHHTRLGGGKALPGPSTEDRGGQDAGDDRGAYDPVEDERRAAEAEEQRQDPPAAETKQKRQLTPQQWVDTYCAEVDRITNVDALDEYVDRKRDALARLEQTEPALHRRAVDHHRARRDAIVEGRLV